MWEHSPPCLKNTCACEGRGSAKTLQAVILQRQLPVLGYAGASSLTSMKKSSWHDAEAGLHVNLHAVIMSTLEGRHVCIVDDVQPPEKA